jgi:polyribonucleotide nucleotidyltransferase
MAQNVDFGARPFDNGIGDFTVGSLEATLVVIPPVRLRLRRRLNEFVACAQNDIAMVA